MEITDETKTQCDLPLMPLTSTSICSPVKSLGTSCKSNPNVHVVGGGNRQSKGLLGRAKYGGEFNSLGHYGSHEGLPGCTLKGAGLRGPWRN